MRAPSGASRPKPSDAVEVGPAVVVRSASAPFHPRVVVEDPLRLLDPSATQELDEIGIRVGQTEDLPAGDDPAAAGGGQLVYDDRRAASHPPSVRRPTAARRSEDAELRIRPTQSARLQALGEGAHRLVPRDGTSSSASARAAASMHRDRSPLAADAELQHPVRRRGRDGALLLSCSLLGDDDLLPDTVESELQPGLQGTEAAQIRWQIVHMCDSRCGHAT